MITLQIAVGVLFVLNIGLVLTVLALARQIGVLFERVSPVGALTLDHGPKIGGPAPRLILQTLSGAFITVGDAAGRGQLFFFLSPPVRSAKNCCRSCASLATAERDRWHVVLASDGDTDSTAPSGSAKNWPCPTFFRQELGMTFQIGRLPYAVAIGPNGIVQRQGSGEQSRANRKPVERGGNRRSVLCRIIPRENSCG